MTILDLKTRLLYILNLLLIMSSFCLVDGSVPQMSLFKHKRAKGWWPFHIKNDKEELELTVRIIS